jgi:hypothetical protein
MERPLGWGETGVGLFISSLNHLPYHFGVPSLAAVDQLLRGVTCA